MCLLLFMFLVESPIYINYYQPLLHSEISCGCLCTCNPCLWGQSHGSFPPNHNPHSQEGLKTIHLPNLTPGFRFITLQKSSSHPAGIWIKPQMIKRQCYLKGHLYLPELAKALALEATAMRMPGNGDKTLFHAFGTPHSKELSMA